MKSISERADLKTKQGILIYGPSLSGKTLLAGTIAKHPLIKRVWALDLENGISVLTNPEVPPHLRLTPQEMEKVIPITIPDTATRPLAKNTVTQLLASPNPHWVNSVTGELSATQKKGDDWIYWPPLHSRSEGEAIIIDSGSQLSASVTAFYANQGLASFDLHAAVGQQLHTIFSAIQASPIPIVYVTHIVMDEPALPVPKREGGGTKPNPRMMLESTRIAQIYPLSGTKQFSMNCSKYFNHKIYTYIHRGRHVVLSTPDAVDFTTPGNRAGVTLHRLEAPTLLDLFYPIREIDTTRKQEWMKKTPDTRTSG